MPETKFAYNLLDEPWIPVLYHTGEYERLGVRKTLRVAHRIRTIAASNPMDRVAVLRFLLAVLYWCQGNPKEGDSEAARNGFPAEWFGKLEEHHECFNLLGDGKRFLQAKDANRLRPVTDLIQEIPTGNNFWHFMHSIDYSGGLCLGCCAMGLLRLPMYSVSGLPNLKSGINGSPPVYTLKLAGNLFSTLTSNWFGQMLLGEPHWAHPVSLTSSDEVPLLVGFTLPARKVWLHASEDAGVCLMCGCNTDVLIKTCEYATAGNLENEKWKDPHVVYSRQSPHRSLKATDLSAPGRFSEDSPLLNLESSYSSSEIHTEHHCEDTNVLMVGLATDKAKYIDVWERAVNDPGDHSGEPSRADLADRWKKQTWIHQRKFSRSDALRKAVFAQVNPDISFIASSQRAMLEGHSLKTWEAVHSHYQTSFRYLTKSLYPGQTTVASNRRQHMARVNTSEFRKLEGESHE